jgi:hypothetical protein
MASDRPTTLLLAASLLGAACEFGDITVYELPPRAMQNVVLTILAEDENAAAQLGWDAGRIPGATVRIADADSTITPGWRFEGFTAADGTIQLEAIPTGEYVVEVSRMLDAEERALARDPAVTAFLGRSHIRPDLMEGGGTVRVPASERRGLVISEIESYVRTATGSHYVQGGYVELYNNSDTTIYLDGKVIARGYDRLYDAIPGECASNAHIRASTMGLYAAAFEKFPGSGREYPLPPGSTVLVAVDAIDHRPFTPHGFDLSRADFEFRGAADVDNPAVPNMVNIGLREGSGFGLVWPAGTTVAFLSDPVDVASLPRAGSPGFEFALFPAAGILDVAVFLNEGVMFPLCQPIMQPSFQREAGSFGLASDPGISLQRRPLLRLPDGRIVLQNTRSARADFYAPANTPGTLPPF